MGSNTFGKILQLTAFGESHGAMVGGVLDGFPSGIEIDHDAIARQMQRRRPGQSELTTARGETDEVEIVSGVFENRSTGAPIAFLIKNRNAKSADYDALKDVFRPSHADYTYEAKYGLRDYRGGGRSSARVTAPVVASGALVQKFLSDNGIAIYAWVHSVHTIESGLTYDAVNPETIDMNDVRCPDGEVAPLMADAIRTAKEEGDSLGGTIICVIKNIPAGLGEPFFGKLHADLAHAMMSINAVKGFEYGSGFETARMKGSESNDAFSSSNGQVHTTTNHSGGIQGGISNGETIYFRIAFKPPASIAREQKSVNSAGENIDLEVKGRHDPCVLPRAVPIVESMAALVIGDHFLRNKVYR